MQTNEAAGSGLRSRGSEVGFDARYRVPARGAKHVKDLDSVCVCWAKPVRLARVEFGDLSGADRGVAASENQAKRSGEDIEPLVPLMGDESRILWGQNLLEDLDPPWVLRQRNDDAPALVAPRFQMYARVTSGGRGDELVQRDPVDPCEGYQEVQGRSPFADLQARQCADRQAGFGGDAVE